MEMKEIFSLLYNFVLMRFSTEWINLESGLAMGCTISPILVVILKAAEGSAGPASLGGGCSMPPLIPFIIPIPGYCASFLLHRRGM